MHIKSLAMKWWGKESWLLCTPFSSQASCPTCLGILGITLFFTHIFISFSAFFNFRLCLTCLFYFTVLNFIIFLLRPNYCIFFLLLDQIFFIFGFLLFKKLFWFKISVFALILSFKVFLIAYFWYNCRSYFLCFRLDLKKWQKINFLLFFFIVWII